MLKILFVTQVRPCPPYGGEKIRVYNLIDSLCRFSRVSLLAPEAVEPCELSQKVRSWYKLPLYESSFVQGTIKSLWYTLNPHPAWKKILDTICRQFKPQVVWFDYEHWGQYVPVVRRFGSRTIMGTHNIQSSITGQHTSILPYSRRYLHFQALNWAQLWHEHNLFQHFDRIISVCETDRQYHAQFVGDTRSKLIPNYINEAWYELDKPITRENNLVVVTGNFEVFAFQNRQSAAWLLKEVWPQVRRQIPQVRLQLVGRKAEEIADVAHRQPGVTCIGEVPTVAPYLGKATIAAVPILHGSGTRFKILEALSCAVPVVSTTLGAQGIDLVSGESAMIADSATEFAQAIINLLKDNSKRTRLAHNGLKVLKNNYNFDTNTQRIRQILEDLTF